MPAGRPTRLTKKVIQAICDAIEAGADYEDAAAAAGISRSTLSKWRADAEAIVRMLEETDGPVNLTPAQWRLVDFWKRFTAAEAQGAVNCATVVYNAAMRDPAYALKWLERRRAESWMPRFREEISTSPLEVVTRIVRVEDGEDRDSSPPSAEGLPR